MTFTFKKQPKIAGRIGIGYSKQNVDIKLGGKVCGTIFAPNYTTKDNNYAIRLMIFKEDIAVDGNTNCDWKWITFKFKSESEQECREFLKNNYKFITEKYNLYFMD
jgi:hypothetical protein